MPSKAPASMKSAERLLQVLGQQLRARRKALGISATAAAESAGVSRVTWHRLEKGEGSVAASAYANAVHVLDLTCGPGIGDARPDMDTSEVLQGWLPARIAVAEYPELGKLAWQVRAGEVLSPREALSIYERNIRHMDQSALTARERALIDALRMALAGDV